MRGVPGVPARLALTDGRRHEQREAVDAADLDRCCRGSRARHAVECKLVEDGTAFVAQPADAARLTRAASPSSTAPYAPRRG